MSTLAFILLGLQLCFVQNVYSQCLGAGPFVSGYGLGYGAAPAAIAGLAPGYGVDPYGLGLGPFGAPAVIPDCAGAYGGTGVGDVAVAGEMPVAGTTLVAGQVPILGAVRFAGDLPATGTVTIIGSCGCGCGSAAYLY